LPIGVEDARTPDRYCPDDRGRAPGAAPRRAALRQHSQTTPPAALRRTPPRPRRWATAVAALIDLQDEYRVWLDTLPANLEGSRLAEKLLAIAELDLEELQMIDPPRGYGRD
jgi:hypothetical protein